MKQRTIAVLLACLVLLSGCSALNPDTPTPEPTETPTTEAPTPTPAPSGAITIRIQGEIRAGETVTVVATRNGDPVTNAEVAVRNVDGDREVVGQTDGEGRLQVTVPGDGRLNVKVRKGSLEGEFQYEPPENEQALRLNVAIVGDVSAGSVVEVRVTQDTLPVGQAEVQVVDENGERTTVGTTNENGSLSVTVPSNGRLNVKVRKGEAEGEVEFGDDSATHLGAIDVSVTRPITPGGTVTVTAMRDGSAVANADVYVRDASRALVKVGTTDANGKLSVPVPASGDLKVKIRKGSLEGEFEYEPAEPVGTIKIAVVGSITAGQQVSVFATHNGFPVANADVFVRNDAGERVKVTTTDANGQATVTVPPSGRLNVKLRQGELEGEFEYEPGEAQQTGLIDVKATGAIEAGSSVTITATRNGAPVVGADVYLKNAQNRLVLAGQTNAQGKLTVTVPSTGDLNVKVRQGELEGELEIEPSNSGSGETESETPG